MGNSRFGRRAANSSAERSENLLVAQTRLFLCVVCIDRCHVALEDGPTPRLLRRTGVGLTMRAFPLLE